MTPPSAGERFKPLGVFGQSSTNGLALQQDLRPLVGVLDRETSTNVSKYLESGAIILAIMEYTADVLESKFGVSGGSAILSDGLYYWRRDAVEYVKNYGIDVGSEAVEHMRRQNWVAPKLSPEQILDLDDYMMRIIQA